MMWDLIEKPDTSKAAQVCRNNDKKYFTFILLDNLSFVHNIRGGVHCRDDYQYPGGAPVQGRYGQHHRQPHPRHDRDGLYRLVHPGVLHQTGWLARQVGILEGWNEYC